MTNFKEENSRRPNLQLAKRAALIFTVACTLALSNTALAQTDEQDRCGTLKTDLVFHRGLPAVELSYGREKVIGIIDTGSSNSAVAQTQLLRWVNEQQTPSSSPENRRVSGLMLNKCSVGDVPVLVAANGANFPDVVFDPAVIILGRDFLRGFDFLIDFPAKAVTLKRGGSASGRTDTPYTIDVTLHGEKSQCRLDTGFAAQARLFMFAENSRAVQLASKTKSTLSAPNERSESGRVTQFFIKDGKVGDLSGTGIVVDLEVASIMRPAHNRHCLVGMGLLSEASVELRSDGAFARVAGNLPHPYYNRSGIEGLSAQRGSGGTGLVIEGVRPGSSFDKAGVRSGDKILKLNGAPIMPISQEDVRQLLAFPAGTELTLTLFRNGQELTVRVIYEEALVDDSSPSP